MRPAREAVGMGGVAAAGGGLCLTDRTGHLAWQENAEEVELYAVALRHVGFCAAPVLLTELQHLQT